MNEGKQIQLKIPSELVKCHPEYEWSKSFFGRNIVLAITLLSFFTMQQQQNENVLEKNINRGDQEKFGCGSSN